MAGKLYISSRRASEISGYAKDYIGQLVRSGKLDAMRVGRSWFVLEASLKKHMGEGTPDVQPQPTPLSTSKRHEILSKLYNPEHSLRTWNSIQYDHDDTPAIPAVAIKSEATIPEITENADLKKTANNIVSSDNLPSRVKLALNPNLSVDGISISSAKPFVAADSHATPDVKRPRGKQIVPAVMPRMFPVLSTAALVLIAYAVLSGDFSLSNEILVGEVTTNESLAAVGVAELVPPDSVFSAATAGLDALSAFLNALSSTFGEYIMLAVTFISENVSRLSEI